MYQGDNSTGNKELFSSEKSLKYSIISCIGTKVSVTIGANHVRTNTTDAIFVGVVPGVESSFHFTTTISHFLQFVFEKNGFLDLQKLICFWFCLFFI